MKKIFLVLSAVVIVLLTGCSSTGNGELIGVQNRPKWFEQDAYGMVRLPSGAVIVGQTEEDVPNAMNTQTKTVSIASFWMDETEITNNEYRQFVTWVVDSLSRRIAGDIYPEDFLIEEDEYQNPIDPPFLNWDTRINMRDEEIRTAIMDELYLPEDQRFFRRNAINTMKLNYEYQWVDYKQAANKNNRYDLKTGEYNGQVTDYKGNIEDITDRSSFIIDEKINIYPDTLCWIADFTYSYNEPYTNLYFWHPGFDDYPVVGVTWEQAKAFCVWRTQLHNNFLVTDQGGAFVQNYRLPTEFEWEYAARGGKELATYPWGGPYTRDEKGCFLANFKPVRGNYADDNSIFPAAVGSYEANDFGLYDMAGNVSEWTISAYDESSFNFVHDLNPNYEYNAKPDDSPALKRKVIKGGSWKDVSYYLRAGARTYEYQDTAKSFIGFRCVRSAMELK